MKKNKLLILGVLLLCGIGAGALIAYLTILKVTLVDDLRVEINSEITTSSLVKNIRNGENLSSDDKIDTSKLGKQSIKLDIQSKTGRKEFEFDIEVVDTTAPEIEAKDEISIIQGEEIDLSANAIVVDNSGENIEATIAGEYDISTPNEYNLEFVAKDSSGNESRKALIFTVKAKPDAIALSDYEAPKMSDRVFITSKGYRAEVIDGILYVDGVLIANKSYSLPRNYGTELTSETLAAFDEFQAGAKDNGLTISITSGFRSFDTQNGLYQNYASSDGYDSADTYSARPGHSEHQTGLAMDLNTLSQSSDNSDATRWTMDNCYKYGFILRYPDGKTNETGYIYEWWHFRYVGKELAEKLYNGGDWITLEDYYGLPSEYRW